MGDKKSKIKCFQKHSNLQENLCQNNQKMNLLDQTIYNARSYYGRIQDLQMKDNPNLDQVKNSYTSRRPYELKFNLLGYRRPAPVEVNQGNPHPTDFPFL